METKLEVRVEQKTLSIGDKRIKLNDNFEKAEVNPDISEDSNEKALELYYSEKKGFSPKEEAERIYWAVDYKGLLDKIGVTPCPDNIYNPKEDSAVTLYGNFKAHIF